MLFIIELYLPVDLIWYRPYTYLDHKDISSKTVIFFYCLFQKVIVSVKISNMLCVHIVHADLVPGQKL